MIKIHDISKSIDVPRLIFDRDFGDVIIVSDDDDLQYIATQFILDPSLPLNENDDFIPPFSASSSDSFEDIDEVLTKHNQKTLFQTISSSKASFLYSLSQKNFRANQLSSISSATTTRGSRSVIVKKSKAQLELKSQQRADQAAKQARTEERKNAAARKIAKTMKPRKNDVSQLSDAFSELRSSQ